MKPIRYEMKTVSCKRGQNGPRSPQTLYPNCQKVYSSRDYEFANQVVAPSKLIPFKVVDGSEYLPLPLKF